MATALPPGIGTAQEVDQANQFMREQPWYQDYLGEIGQRGGPVKLSDDQEAKLLSLARSKGIGISDHFEIDESGNIRPKSNLGRNLLIGAGIVGGALLAGPAIAGLFTSGAGDAAATAAAAETAAGGAEAADALAAASAIEGGATGIAEDIGASLGAADVAGGAAGAAGDFVGPLAAGAGGTADAPSVLSSVGGALKGGLSTYDKISQALRLGGSALGEIGKSAADKRLTQEELALRANEQNIQGMSAMEQALMRRAMLEEEQRQTAGRDVARQSFASTFRGSPFNPRGGPQYSSTYMNVANALAGQGAQKLSSGAQYDTSKLPPSPSYTPIDVKNVPRSTGTEPSAWSNVGGAVAPILSGVGGILKLFGRGGQQ